MTRQYSPLPMLPQKKKRKRQTLAEKIAAQQAFFRSIRGVKGRMHPPPKTARIRKALVKIKLINSKEPNGESAGFRRGFIECASWVLGENGNFDRRFKTRGDK